MMWNCGGDTGVPRSTEGPDRIRVQYGCKLICPSFVYEGYAEIDYRLRQFCKTRYYLSIYRRLKIRSENVFIHKLPCCVNSAFNEDLTDSSGERESRSAFISVMLLIEAAAASVAAAFRRAAGGRGQGRHVRGRGENLKFTLFSELSTRRLSSSSSSSNGT